jgi:hypothetical protein
MAPTTGDSHAEDNDEPMRNRRQEDQPLHVIVPPPPTTAGDARTVAGLEAGEYEVDPRTGVLSSASVGSMAGASDPCLYLIDSGENDLLLIAGTELERIPRTGVRPDLRERLLSHAVARQRITRYEQHRLEALKRFVLLIERLTRAKSRSEVFDALAENALAIVGGSVALVFSRSTGTDDGGTWEVTHSSIPLPPEATTFADDQLLSSAPGLVSGDAMPTAVPILAATGASALAYAGIGDSEILFIAERRTDRTFHANDWYHLKLIARETEIALTRVRAA